ncbi:dihydrolipoyl dehydrogenase family protein [Fodinicurvata sediminis]|uniref:dihydrolipoyl dehydrogenase family protein n=1 Tax=Fodinicurvata sediminis TaxID=1121832 RepID=UPI0003B3FAE1|nr:FAD-dependent oxidoreductase [Fodinicurvata sediminis]
MTLQKTEETTCDICVIGGGSAGLSVAAGASQMGADTILVERGEMGGDCLNSGCVPSKSLLAAAKAARSGAKAAAFGIAYDPPRIDFEAVQAHVQQVIAGIAPHDSVERFEGLGVRVLRDSASFHSPHELVVGEQRIRARRFVLATGSRALVPPVSGLAETPYLTNESIFALKDCPDHLIVLGGGPIGCELGQAFRRLGARVSLVEMNRLLPREDRQAAELLRERLQAEGVEIHENAGMSAVQKTHDGIQAQLKTERGEATLEGSHLLVATGRQPVTDGLNLEAAEVIHDSRGIKVDARLRTSNRRIFAAGDVAGGPQFTHAASYQAGIILRNALFRLPARVNYAALPRVTYCTPELAQVGLTVEEAQQQGKKVEILQSTFAENDRARCEHATDGFIKIVATRSGAVLGATIIGPQAGELILPWGLAIARRMKLSALAGIIAPYPTLSEISKQVAGSHYTPKLFSSRTRWLVRLLLRLG